MFPLLLSSLVTGVLTSGPVAAAAPEDAVRFSASLRAGKVEVGRAGIVDVVVQVNEDDGYRLAGTPKPVPPLLQMKAPPSIELLPARVKRGEHLRPPYEVTVEGGRREIRFRVLSQPKPADALVLNLVAYVEREGTDQAWLIRRRGRIEIKPGASLVAEPADRNDWQESSTLTLGADAVPFELPDKDGKLYDLREHLGKKNIILVMYRAFW